MTTWYCYKMKIVFFFLMRLLEGETPLLQHEDWFYHQITERGHPTTTKWRLVLYDFIIILLEGNTSTLRNHDWKGYCRCFTAGSACSHHLLHITRYKMRLGFYMLSSDGQIPLLQNDFRFLKVFQLPKHWTLIKCNSQAVATKCLALPRFGILI